MPFEDLLKPPPPKCKTCSFIANLPEPLQTEVRTAVSKPIYSDEQLAVGMRQIDSEYNPAPGRTNIQTHRQKGHA